LLSSWRDTAEKFELVANNSTTACIVAYKNIKRIGQIKEKETNIPFTTSAVFRKNGPLGK